MSDVQPPARVRRYRFSRPDDTEVEASDLGSDEAAESRARELSRSTDSPIVVKRHSAHVDAWEYVAEADERA